MPTIIETQYMEAVKSIAHKMSSSKIDWEARRYEIAKEIYAVLVQKDKGDRSMTGMAIEALLHADYLITALKNEPSESET